jgi:quercetin dioxygenase-like cupin family protein
MPSYKIRDRKVIAETADLRVVRMEFVEGEFIPWHYHTYVGDTTFCLAGTVVVDMMEPCERVTLGPGQYVEINAGRPHRVGGPGERVTLLVQGVGLYDFVESSGADR